MGDLLGLGAPTEETPVRLTPEALADVFGSEATPENLAAALELGYLGTDGGEIVHISRRLLEVSAALVREGIPLADVLAAGRRVREHAEALAEVFADLMISHNRSPRTPTGFARWRRASRRRNSPSPWTGGCASGSPPRALPLGR